MLSDLKLLLGITVTTQDSLLNLLLEMADDLAKRTLYPFTVDISVIVLPSKYNMWIVQASKEMYQNMGNESVRSYSENGLSITYKDLTSGISKDLLSQLIPKAGLPE
jgi:hypothetical protein